LSTGLAELLKEPDKSRRKYLIFLTDGASTVRFNPAVVQPAIEQKVEIYTIGLGSSVESDLLKNGIAVPTGGKYFPVSDAEELWPAFQQIHKEAIRVDMAGHAEGASSEYPLLFFLLRVLSWGVMGLVIGFGQGVRENTREDLKACSLGGIVGGFIGGATFDPLSQALGAGLLGRLASDVVVGACIGGSMRLAQGYLVDQQSEQSTTLLTMLPKRSGGLVAPSPAGNSLRPANAKGLTGLVLKMKDAVEAADDPAAQSSRAKRAPAAGNPKPAESRPQQTLSLDEITQRSIGNRRRAMAAAAAAGYSVEQIAAHFGVRRERVEQAIQRAKGGDR
jgi:hypothetical protein